MKTHRFALKALFFISVMKVIVPCYGMDGDEKGGETLSPPNFPTHRIEQQKYMEIKSSWAHEKGKRVTSAPSMPPITKKDIEVPKTQSSESILEMVEEPIPTQTTSAEVNEAVKPTTPPQETMSPAEVNEAVEPTTPPQATMPPAVEVPKVEPTTPPQTTSTTTTEVKEGS